MKNTSGDSRALFIRGTLLTVFGLAALLWPDATWITLVRLMGIFALLDAGFALGFASVVRNSDGLYKPMLFSGIFGLIFGALLLLLPEFSASVLTTLIGIWLLIMAGFLLGMAGTMRGLGLQDRILLIIGILTAVLGLALLIKPLFFVKTLAWIIGFAALASGLLILRRARYLRRMGF